MEGLKHGDRNEIYLKFSGEKMAAALSMAKQCTNHIKIKLSDTIAACLLVELSLLADDEDKTDHIIAHQVPVEIVHRTDWTRLELPTNLDYKVTLRLPEFRSFKTLIDSYKVLSPKIKILLTPGGECCLVTEQIEHTTTSTYRNLEVVPSSGKGSDREGMVLIESKRIASILSGNQFLDANVFLSIHNDLMLRIRFEVRDAMVINCLLPGILESDDEDNEDGNNGDE
jgi:Hus1-like protein